jgi:sugar/nucleoside kinase (ribokinase family)
MSKIGKKILTIGGATQDIYLSYRGTDLMRLTQSGSEQSYMLFESGAKIEVEEILYYTGGGATNSAVSFKRLGFDVSCFCMLGDDLAAKAVLDDLGKDGVDTSHIEISKKHPTAISFVINSLTRDRTIFAYRGANSFLKKEQIPFEAIESADQLYITSLSNESSKILSDIVKYAKKHKIPVAINPGSSQLSTGARELKESLKYIDTLILNSSEAKTFMGALVEGDKKYKKVFACDEAQLEPEEGVVEGQAPGQAPLLKTPLLHKDLYFSITNFFKEVMKMGPKIVVVTDGASGVYVSTGRFVLFHPSLKVDALDALGAGDSFGSCFVASMCRGLSVEEALFYGIVNSSSVIGHMGAKPGLLSYDKLEKRVKEIRKEMGEIEANSLQRYELE